MQSREKFDPTDMRPQFAWWKPENFDANVAMVNELAKLAETKGAIVSQLALAWLLAKKDYIVPIPGLRNPERVAENVAAAELTLTPEDVARIDEIVPDGGIGGRSV